MAGRRHNSSIVEFQRKRGRESAAFLLPFLTPEMTVLDIGCGPGTITVALAEAVGSAIGVDVEPGAIDLARHLAASLDVANLRFVEADMTALPFEDGSVDAVLFHAVLYHQSRAVLTQALAEAKRVLKLGGLLGTRDTDTGGNVLHPELPGLQLALDLWQRWYEHDDEQAIRFGRRQGAVLRDHGFTPIWRGASYVNHSADEAIRKETVADARRSLSSLGPDLARRGLATKAELREALAAWELWGTDPDAVYFRCRCECVARKD